MAVVTEMEQVSSVIPPMNGAEPPKRPRGRPKKVAPPVTEPDDDEPEVQITGDTDFWMTLANFTSDQWQQHIAYLYRTGPVIDRKSNGRPVNLCKYSTAFDREDIMKEHGSGGYRIDLCRLDPISGKSFRIAQERFTIINPKYPPNVPPGDWVEDKANDIWKWAAPKVDGQAVAGYPPGFNMERMYDKAFEFAEKLAPKPTDNTGNNELLIKLIDVATARHDTPAPPPPPPPDTTAMDRMFKMQDEMLKDMREELRELRKTQSTPQKSLIEQFVEIKPQLQDLLKMFGEKSSKTDLWLGLAEKGIEQIPDLIELGRDFIKKPEPQQNGHHQAQSAAIAATPTSTATAEPPTKPVEQMTEDEKRAYVDQLWKKWGGHLVSTSTRLIEEFTINDQGYTFRDWYCEMHGKLKWGDLRRDLEPQLMTNMFLAHPQLAKALAPPERLLIFLSEFQTDFGNEDDTPIKEKLDALKKTAGVEPDEVIPAAKQNEAKTK
jgi:hypothetical protein